MALAHDEPNLQLAAELREVARDANQLAVHLRGDNSLGPPFPVGQLTSISQQLSRLPDNTAAGALELLDYASRRLPEIRREFLALESSTESSHGSSDEPPMQIRGMALDKFLKDLIASVGTALAECRRQEGDTTEHVDEVDVRIVHEGANREIRSAERAASDLAAKVDGATSAVADIGLPSTATSKALGRNLNDVAALGRMAATELSFKVTVMNWVRRIGTVMNRYPELIVKLGNSIQLGSELGKATYLRWEDFKHKILHLLAEEINKVGGDLEALGRRLETARAEKGSNPDQGMSSLEIERKVLIEKIHLAGDRRSQRSEAIAQLVGKFADHPETALLLADRAKNDPANSIRKFSARALRDLPVRPERAEELITRLLAAYDRYPRTEVGAAIVEILSRDKLAKAGGARIREFLTDAVLDSRDSTQTIVSIGSLLRNYGAEPAIQELASELVKTYPDANVRSSALAGLIANAPGSCTRETITWVLSQRDNVSLRVQALDAIAKKGRAWPWALELVVSLEPSEVAPKILAAISRAKATYQDDGSEKQHTGKQQVGKTRRR